MSWGQVSCSQSWSSRASINNSSIVIYGQQGALTISKLTERDRWFFTLSDVIWISAEFNSRTPLHDDCLFSDFQDWSSQQLIMRPVHTLKLSHSKAHLVKVLSSDPKSSNFLSSKLLVLRDSMQFTTELNNPRQTFWGLCSVKQVTWQKQRKKELSMQENSNNLAYVNINKLQTKPKTLSPLVPVEHNNLYKCLKYSP